MASLSRVRMYVYVMMAPAVSTSKFKVLSIDTFSLLARTSANSKVSNLLRSRIHGLIFLGLIQEFISYAKATSVSFDEP